MSTNAQREIDRWFVRRGLPHFIERYDAGRDIWTRSLPVLAVAYLLLGLNALQVRDWSVAQNLLALAGLVVVLLATWALANVVRRRPAFSRPRKVGPAELAVFVVGPALPALIFGGQLRDAAEAIVEAIVVLVVIYVATSYGLPSMTRWALGRLGTQLFTLGQLLAKALPLITLLVTFLFLTTETWQVAGTLAGPAYWIGLGLFVAVGVLFLLSRLPRDLREVGHFASWEDVAERVAGTPAAPLLRHRDGVPQVAPLGRRQRLNVGLVLLISQGIQILLVALLVGAFVVGFGVLAVSEQVTADWVAPGQLHVLWSATLGGRALVLTEELLRVAGFLVAFTGLNFTVYLVTDESYRSEFRDEVIGEVRQAFAVRAVSLSTER